MTVPNDRPGRNEYRRAETEGRIELELEADARVIAEIEDDPYEIKTLPIERDPTDTDEDMEFGDDCA